jgi:hypothetical protein
MHKTIEKIELALVAFMSNTSLVYTGSWGDGFMEIIVSQDETIKSRFLTMIINGAGHSYVISSVKTIGKQITVITNSGIPGHALQDYVMDTVQATVNEYLKNKK